MNKKETGTNGGLGARSGTARTKGRPARTKVRATGCTDSGTDEWIVVHVTCQRELKFALRGLACSSGDRHDQRCGQPDVQFRAQMNDCCACDLSTRTKFALRGVGVPGQETGTNSGGYTRSMTRIPAL